MKIRLSPVLIGVVFFASLVGIYYLFAHKPPVSGTIYHPTDIVTPPTTAPQNICMSNSECGTGKYCQQICLNSTNGTCSPGKCVDLPGSAS